MSRDTYVMCNALITMAASQTKCHVGLLTAVSDLILDVSHIRSGLPLAIPVLYDVHV